MCYPTGWEKGLEGLSSKLSGVLELQALECMVLLSFNYLCSPLCECWYLKIGLLFESAILVFGLK